MGILLDLRKVIADMPAKPVDFSMAPESADRFEALQEKVDLMITSGEDDNSNADAGDTNA
jgi:hypothetical protein